MLLKSNLECVYITKGGRFITPGTNIIPDEEGTKLLENVGFSSKIKAGIFTIVKETVETDIVDKPLKEEMSDEKKSAQIVVNNDLDEAISIVEELLDIKVLRAILEVEKRKEVITAVEETISILTEEKEDF